MARSRKNQPSPQTNFLPSEGGGKKNLFLILVSVLVSFGHVPVTKNILHQVNLQCTIYIAFNKAFKYGWHKARYMNI
jgi:hypothetical protein